MIGTAILFSDHPYMGYTTASPATLKTHNPHYNTTLWTKLMCTSTPVPVSVSLVVSCTPGVELAATVLSAREIQVNVHVL